MEQNQIYNKFTVIKNEDIEEYLTVEQKAALQGIKLSIALKRLNDSKKKNKYLVVNVDEPYAKYVKDMILNKE